MRAQSIKSLVATAGAALALLALEAPLPAQNAAPKTNSKILFNGGPVMRATSNIYFIWYGCWREGCGIAGDPAAVTVITDFITSLGGSPYMAINAGYPDNVMAPSGGLVYGGAVEDLFSRGTDLTQADVEAIVSNALDTGALPLDTRGIYVVLASADVASTETGFCSTSCQFHRAVQVQGSLIKYALVGNGVRCPGVCAAPFVDADGRWLPTPNANMTADAMVSWLAHVVSGTLTNPLGTAWYDRYGLENSDKCVGTYGDTYITSNGAVANMRLGARDYLIQQNWVNGRRARCALQP